MKKLLTNFFYKMSSVFLGFFFLLNSTSCSLGESTLKSAENGIEIETLFSYPQGSDFSLRDLRLEFEIISLINNAKPGSSIRASLYLLSRSNIAEALIAAYRNNVDVQIVVSNFVKNESGVLNNTVQSLKQELGNRIYVCSELLNSDSGGCLGNRTNHNKYLLLSSLKDGRKNVVVQSSANWNAGSLNYFESMIIMSGDHKIYQAYMDYWTDQRAENKNINYYKRILGLDDISVSFLPNQVGDPVYEKINSVDCRSGSSEIRVLMGWFTDGRSQVANLLVQKAAEGCLVKVISAEDKTEQGIDCILSGGSVLHKVTKPPEPNVHSKNILVQESVVVNGETKLKYYVLSGSHNLTGSSLSANEEAYLEIEKKDIYKSFKDNFERIWNSYGDLTDFKKDPSLRAMSCSPSI